MTLKDHNEKIVKESIRKNKETKDKKQTDFDKSLEDTIKSEATFMIKNPRFFQMPDLSDIDWSK